MSTLQNKRILLGVTGGIAAYKSAELLRLLQKQGAEVRVVMTRAAQEFITPLTMQALSGFPVSTELLDPEAEAGMGHIELARWADLILIAPATADFITKLVQGQGDDLLSTVCLAARCQIAVAPAMNQAMWSNKATQENIDTLAARNVLRFGPAEGIQACGDSGFGRMLEPELLVSELKNIFSTGALTGKTVVITAGPTREAIDPVRYLTNHSSGKMGYALAEAARDAGARTVLISGPTNLAQPDRCEFVSVMSADEMLDAALAHVSGADIFIAAAAVSDYKPAQQLNNKMKKGESDSLTLELVKNPDIVATIAAQEPKPYVLGFAAETQDVLAYASAKLEKKNLDAIVANDVSNTRIGFNSDNNAVHFISSDMEETFTERSKSQLARDLIELVAKQNAVT